MKPPALETRPVAFDQSSLSQSRLAFMRLLTRNRSLVLGLLGMQLIALLIFSWYQANHFALTQDFSAYYQAWYLIAHGQLNPPETAFRVQYFWQDHFSLIMWLLAPLYWIWPHAVTLLWIQDGACVGAEVMVWQIAQILWERAGYSKRLTAVLNLCLVTLLVANPWTYWGTAFDFHPYSLGLLTSVLALYQFVKNRAIWTYVWAALTTLGGDVVATYVLGLAITVFVLGPKGRRYHSFVIAAIGLAFLVIFAVTLKSHSGSVPGHLIASHSPSQSTNVGFLGPYSYIVGSHAPLTVGNLVAGVLFHPGRWLSLLWHRRMNLWANVGPSGFIGLFSPWGLGIPLIAGAQVFLAKAQTFTTDFAQLLPVYALMSLGTVYWLGKILKGRPKIGMVVTGIVVLNTLGWAMIWIPRWPHHWVSVATPVASVLSRVEQTIPKNHEVIASQGIMGRFSNRHWIYPFDYGSLPLKAPITDIILSPYQGTNVLPVNVILSRIAFLSQNPHVTLIKHQDGIWVFQDVRGGQSRLSFPPASAVPGWAMGTATGTPVTTGLVSDWHMAAGYKPGYVTDQAYWRLKPGRYQVSAVVATTGPINIEVWNSTADRLLTRKTISLSSGRVTASLDFENQHQYPSNTFRGWGPFRVTQRSASAYNAIEVRIWSPGDQTVNVYQLSISVLAPKSVKVTH